MYDGRFERISMYGVISLFLILTILVILCSYSDFFKTPEEIKNQKLIKLGYKYFEWKSSYHNSYINLNIINSGCGYFKDVDDLKLFLAAGKNKLEWFREIPND